MAFESFLVGNFTCAGYFEPLFGTRIGLNLGHFLSGLNYTLLADPHWQITFGADWANMHTKMERKVSQFELKKKENMNF